MHNTYVSSCAAASRTGFRQPFCKQLSTAALLRVVCSHDERRMLPILQNPQCTIITGWWKLKSRVQCSDAFFWIPAGSLLRGRDPFEKISRHCGNYQEVPEHKSSLQVQVCSGFITFAFVFPGVSSLQTAPLLAPRCHGCCALDKDAQDDDDDDDDVVCCTLLFSCCFCMLKNHIRCEMIVPLCD